jgi:hypothetical protein
MKGSDMPKRTDVILSVATLALAIVAAGVIVATASTDEFVAWAWAPPQHPELVHKAPIFPAFLLLRLQTQPLGYRAHPTRAGHEHVLVSCS